jgi:DMSO/TMAO reductase YedYZ molybdopterin-dependent catalytic subunit
MTSRDDALSRISAPSRVAAFDESIGFDELGMAARNHGMLLEGMRHDITPLGMHYLLIHYDVPDVDPDAWRLTIDGLVQRPAALSLADLRSRPRVTAAVTLECAGNGRARMLPRPVSQPWLNEAVGTMEWTGTLLRPLLDEAGVTAGAVDVVFTGLDHGVERGVEQDYARSLPLSDALGDDVLLADEANGQPLLPQHGSPVRLIVPGWYGMAHVKWLTRIDVIDREFDGYQQSAYRLRTAPDDPGVAVTRIEPRALLIPPGWPDFLSRRRFLRAGRSVLAGRAWSGWAEIDQVEVSLDDGATWRSATLGPPAGRWAWRRWSLEWDAAEGSYSIAVRARDASGRRQSGADLPERPGWNRGGFANPAAQRVEVLVLA